MAVEGIKISLGEVSATAGTIRTLNTSLNDKLLAIQKQMNDLASTWQSPAVSAKFFCGGFDSGSG